MKKFLILASISTIVFSSHAFANPSFDCKSLANTTWIGNVSTETGRISRKINIEIKDVVLNTSQGEDYYYNLTGSINGKALAADESTCWEDKYESHPKVSVITLANYETGVVLKSNHTLPTQIPVSGLLRNDDQGNHLKWAAHVDGMIMKK